MIYETAQDKAELCEGMRDVFEKQGHCTGRFKDFEGRVCLIGAAMEVAVAQGRTEILEHSYINDKGVMFGVPHYWFSNEVTDILGFGTVSHTISTNDHGTKETVMDVVIERAKYWREQG